MGAVAGAVPPGAPSVGGALAGGSLVRRGATFTSDGARLAVCCGAAVHLHSSATGAPLRTLAGHGGEVTVVARPPGESDTLYTASADGMLRLWDVTTGACLRTLEAPGGVEALVFAPAPSPLAFLSCHKPGADAGRVVCYNLAKGRVVDTLGKASAPPPLAISAPGRYLAAFERQTVSIWSVGTLTASHSGPAPGAPMPASLRLHHTKVITALALDPREERLAAGDATGRILLWHGFAPAADAAAQRGFAAAAAAALGSGAAAAGEGASGVRVPLATMHWHSSAVGFVAFSADGLYLLSGGAEAVLVLWRLDSGARQFLPRCGGPLRGVAQSPSDAALVALACGDNAHRLVNTAALQCEAVVAGARPPRLRPACAGGAAWPAFPAWDPRTRAVVLAAAGGALQWYDLARDAEVGLLAVVDGAGAAPPPPPPADSGGATPLEPHVAHFALGPGGRTLATLERRGEAGAAEAAETLRFWELPRATLAPAAGDDAAMDADDDGGDEGDDNVGGGVGGGASYRLSTRVEAPHRGGVSALAHHPAARVAATASASGADFRVWARGRGKAGPAAAWRCRSVGFYQGRPMHALAFSRDGSVLAVGAGDAATLWAPATNALLAVLHPPAPGGPPLTHLSFLDGTDAAGEPLLAGASAGAGGAFTCWSVLRCDVARHHAPLHITAAACDAARGRVALAVQPPPQAGRPHGAVLCFGGASAELQGAWALGAGAAPPTLLFVPMPAAGADVALPEALLICTDDRRFALAEAAGGADAAAALAAARATANAAASSDAADHVSGFTAAFGKLPAGQAAAEAAAVAAGGAALAAPRAGGGGWRPIVDAPSHALPSLLSLLPAYMEALLRETEPQK